MLTPEYEMGTKLLDGRTVGGKTAQKSTRYPSDYSGNSSLVPLAVAVMPYDTYVIVKCIVLLQD